MDKLAAELICMIFEYLPNNDAASLRLLSRTFASVGLYHIGSSVVFTCTTKSLNDLRSLSLHPILSRNVKSLYYEATLLSPKLDAIHNASEYTRVAAVERQRTELGEHDLKYKQVVDILASVEIQPGMSPREMRASRRAMVKQAFGSDKAFSERQIENSLQILRDTRSDQRTCFRKRADLRILRKVIPKLENLKSFRFSNYSSIKDMASIYRLAFDKMPWFPLRQRPSSNLAARNLLALLTPMFRHGTSSGGDLNLTINPELLQCFRQTIVQNLQEGFAQVKSICLSFQFDSTQSLERRATLAHAAFCKGLLAEWLGALKNLEVLTISLVQYHADPEVRIFDLVEYHTWPKLRSVDLADFTTDEYDLQDLLERHKHTLKELWLTNVELIDGDWLDMTDFIAQHLHLECFGMYGLFYDTSPTLGWIMDYVERGSNDDDGERVTLGAELMMYVLDYHDEQNLDEDKRMINPLYLEDEWVNESEL